MIGLLSVYCETCFKWRHSGDSPSTAPLTHVLEYDDAVFAKECCLSRLAVFLNGKLSIQTSDVFSTRVRQFVKTVQMKKEIVQEF